MGMLSRRDFVGTLTAATATGLIGANPQLVRAEPPPETTRIRIAKVPAICLAPMYVAEELLRGEGFTDVRYVEMDLPKIALLSPRGVPTSAPRPPRISSWSWTAAGPWLSWPVSTSAAMSWSGAIGSAGFRT